MPPKKKQTYVKMDPITHILKRPDMYVGSIISKDVEEFVVVDDEYHIAKRTINVSPAILRIFIEPLSNVIDNVARSKKGKNKVTKISIEINSETGETSFWNDGDVIPIQMHEEEKCYNHSLIFGQLLTGSNYDDEEDRLDISGKNGLGIKLCNVYSSEFTIDSVDPQNKKKLLQTWRSNMREDSGPEITDIKSTRGYTRVTFTPDFTKFGLEGYTQDIIDLYKRFVVDTAMITKVPVFLNDQEIPVKNLVDYAKLYGASDNFLAIKTATCDVVVMPSNEFEAISFANGVYTPHGGAHVDAWCEAIFRPIVTKLNKPKKPQVTIADVKKFFRVFVVATVVKPIYDSQSKLKLESPVVEAEVKKTHIAAICKWPIMEHLEDIIRAKEMVVLKKAERKTRGYQRVEGLDPANNEGGTKGRFCTLILVEGLSAKSYAANGIQRGAFGRQGRDWFGIYALRGKLLNCRNSKPVSIAKNNVVTDIIKALGIKYDIDYTDDENYKKLRYGRVLIITDADVDGIHISGLLQNMFNALFPSLLERKPAFLTSMQTPIVKITTGPKSYKWFYDEQEYKKFTKTMSNKKITKKYYKGLGSSNKKDVAETFGKKLVEFETDEKCYEEMNKAFHTKYADLRKEWLANYDPANTILKWNGTDEEVFTLSHSGFINTELIKFSLDDCKRSIPSLMDGLKEGHRKVLYATMLRKGQKYSGTTIKVSQLAGDVSLKTGYHHGEQNLFKTITTMANAYVGSNNIPLLFRDGQFGSRAEGGKDAADGRYIFTKLDEMTRYIFRAEDDVLLEYLDDDDKKIEPKFYVPILPMILVNGCIAGIGTGWASCVPCYNPLDLIASIKVWLDNDGNVFSETEDNSIVSLLPGIVPWYRGYKGNITSEGDHKYTSWGVVDKKDSTVHITELPIGLWISDFTERLEKFKEEKQIADYKNYSTPDKVNYVIKESEDGIVCDENNLKLHTGIRTSNMVLFSEQGGLKKYSSTDEIIDSYCRIRYEYYIKRKAYILNNLEHDIKFLGNKKRFLEEVRDGIIKLFEENKGNRQSRKTIDIVKELEEKGYDKDTKDNEENDDEDEEEKEEQVKKRTGHGYEYLLRLQISSITAEKINKIKNDIANCISQRDELSATSEKDLWIRELDEFESVYEKYVVRLEEELAEAAIELMAEQKKKRTKKPKNEE